MEEKKIYKDVIIYSSIICLILSFISFIIFKDIYITSGIIIGTFARIIGFLMIIENSKTIIKNQTPGFNSIAGYISRFIVYGIIIASVLYFKVNVFSLIIGLSIINLVIFVLRKRRYD